MEPITLVLTSCGRLDLLRRTVESLFTCNTHAFHRSILIDGSCEPRVYEEIENTYKTRFEMIFNESNLGQAATIDRAYAEVDTEYIFHCEDDWDFHGAGFVEESLEILLENPGLLQVWIRDHDDSSHPRLPRIYFTSSGVPYRRLCPNHRGWRGFSWSPGLRRLSDYNLIRPYSHNYFARSANPWEKAAGLLYSRLGFSVASTINGYCRHSGAKRHIPIPLGLSKP
jgi:GT2 family glycosyltransferase